MNIADLTALLDRLRTEPRESDWFEFNATRLEFVAAVVGLGSVGTGDGGVAAW